MAIIGQGISLRGMVHEDFHYPFFLAAGIVAADVGKPVAIDATAANTVKIAGDGDIIIGQLVSWEDRTVEGVLVGTVALRGGFKFTKSGVINVGDSVVGAATSGSVKAALAADYTDNMVVESGTDYVIVVR